MLVVASLLAVATPALADPGDFGDATTLGPDLPGGLSGGGWSEAIALELPPAPRGLVPELARISHENRPSTGQ